MLTSGRVGKSLEWWVKGCEQGISSTSVLRAGHALEVKNLLYTDVVVGCLQPRCLPLLVPACGAEGDAQSWGPPASAGDGGSGTSPLALHMSTECGASSRTFG